MFFVTGLPRSRTAWMAAYLTTRDVVCHHELLNGSTREGFYRAMSCVGRVGDSDCGLPFTDFQYRWAAPTVIIERPIGQVMDSLLRLGLGDSRAWVEGLAEKLESISGLRVGFDDLDARMPEVCAHLGLQYDPRRHAFLKKMNVQLQEVIGDQESFRIWN